MKFKNFVSMLSFLAAAFISLPVMADDPNIVPATYNPPGSVQEMQSQASLTPQQQVDNIQATLTLEESYVMNLRQTDPTMYCLAQNAFFEARAESLLNKVAVTEVVKNRLDSGKYAGTLCAIVKQKNSGICQFSWVCEHLGVIPLRKRDGEIDERVYKQWYDSVLAAYIVQNNLVDSVVPGALNFYAQHLVRPSWVGHFVRVAVIGGHTFMRPRE